MAIKKTKKVSEEVSTETVNTESVDVPQEEPKETVENGTKKIVICGDIYMGEKLYRNGIEYTLEINVAQELERQCGILHVPYFVK